MGRYTKYEGHTELDWWIDDDGNLAAGHGDDYTTLNLIETPDGDLAADAPALLARCKRLEAVLAGCIRIARCHLFIEATKAGVEPKALCPCTDDELDKAIEALAE